MSDVIDWRSTPVVASGSGHESTIVEKNWKRSCVAEASPPPSYIHTPNFVASSEALLEPGWLSCAFALQLADLTQSDFWTGLRNCTVHESTARYQPLACQRQRRPRPASFCPLRWHQRIQWPAQTARDQPSKDVRIRQFRASRRDMPEYVTCVAVTWNGCGMYLAHMSGPVLSGW